MMTKTCSKCGTEKQKGDFYKAARTRDKVSSWCKSCHNKWSRIYAKDNPERRKAYHQTSYKKNRDVYLARGKVYRDQHPEVAKKARKAWEAKHPEYRNQMAAKVRERNRIEAFNAYGGFVCACCEEREPMFLTIDHIGNDGAAHRKSIGNAGGSGFFAWLRRNKHPTGFQVLCRNCNWGKHANGGVCPHQGSEGSTTRAQARTSQANGDGSAERPSKH